MRRAGSAGHPRYHCRTVKGKGVSFMENVMEWHSGVLNDEQYSQALAEIRHRPATTTLAGGPAHTRRSTMSESYFQRVAESTPNGGLSVNSHYGQEIDLALSQGAVGSTTNPSYAGGLLRREPEYVREVLEKLSCPAWTRTMRSWPRRSSRNS